MKVTAAVGQTLRRGERMDAIVDGTTEPIKVVRQDKPGVYIVELADGSRRKATVQPLLVLGEPVYDMPPKELISVRKLLPLEGEA